jgi:hypothetical protein
MDINVTYYQCANQQPIRNREVKTMRNNKIIVLAGVAALMASMVFMNIQNASASSAFAEGSREGKADGHRDAINKEPSDARCGSGHSNDYCVGYKIAYNAEYAWTRLWQD